MGSGIWGTGQFGLLDFTAFVWDWEFEGNERLLGIHQLRVFRKI